MPKDGPRSLDCKAQPRAVFVGDPFERGAPRRDLVIVSMSRRESFQLPELKLEHFSFAELAFGLDENSQAITSFDFGAKGRGFAGATGPLDAQAKGSGKIAFDDQRFEFGALKREPCAQHSTLDSILSAGCASIMGDEQQGGEEYEAHASFPGYTESALPRICTLSFRAGTFRT